MTGFAFSKIMCFGPVRVLLLIVFFHHSLSTEIKEVKPRWMYNNKKNKETLPDLIQIDLEIKSNKVTINLLKQSMGPIKPPLIISDFNGLRTDWKRSKKEHLGIYKDLSIDASATVSTKTIKEMQQTLYMLSFTHDHKRIHVEPRSTLIETNKLYLDSTSNRTNNEDKGTLLSIDGVPHLLFETPSTKLQNNKGYTRGEKLKRPRIMRRSNDKVKDKRLMTVEIFTLIDYSIFKKFYTESKATEESDKKDESRTIIQFFLTHIMEGVKNVFESLEIEGLKFTTKWVGAFIAERSDDLPFVQYSIEEDGSININKAAEWVNRTASKDVIPDLPNHDFLAFLTSDTVRRREKVLKGHSVGEVCTPVKFGFVHHKRFFATVALIAHELAHALNVEHDGVNRICTEDNYYNLMENNIHLEYEEDFRITIPYSKCTVDYLKKFVEKIDSEGNNCLLDGEDFKLDREADIFLNSYPGQIFDVNEQCKMAYGPEYIYHGGTYKDKEICWKVTCLAINKNDSAVLLRPLDGTTCKNKSWCIKERCVKDSRAPRVPENCINGDNQRPEIFNKVIPCDIEKGHRCRNSYLREECCVTCAKHQTIVEGCQDTIDECTILEPKDCYHDYYASACCKTCRAFIKNPSDTNCLYGDRDDRCSDMVPVICHLSKRYCCQTCSAFHNVSTNNTKDYFKRIAITKDICTLQQTNIFPKLQEQI